MRIPLRIRQDRPTPGASGRRRRTAALLGLGTVITGTFTGVLAAGPAVPANAACTPAWKMVPAAVEATEVQDVQVLSPKDVRFTANVASDWGAGMSETVWNGSKNTAAGPQIPLQPKRSTFSGSRSSYDSASSGWVIVSPGGGWGDIATVTMGRWDGSKWTLVPTAPSPDPEHSRVRLSDVASVAPDDAWAVGALDGNGGLIEHWDGTEWTVADHPSSSTAGTQLIQISAASANDVWAVGLKRQSESGGAFLPYAEHYDGTRWTEVGLPSVAAPGMPDGIASTVVAKGPNDVYVGGWRGTWADWNGYRGLVMHWDGQKWSVDTGPGDVVQGGFMDGVYSSGPDDLWAIADSTLLHRTGTTWTKVVPEGAQPGGGGAGVGYYYRAVAGSGPDDVWAVGSLIYTEPAPIPGLAYANTRTVLAHLTCGGR
ncbi:hypothetical protein [Actinomadura oligospora]|uniref:hypothetical protein n=1 Tax=Actinomadura oligospora TaxID=111804 RepID=UPI0004B3308B|nr:hypothetical protein [Actinomadura oligospora]